jgi:paraquat-inducible protein A
MRPCAGKVYFRMATLIGCQGCDLLVDVAGMPEGGRANCPRCGHFLARYRSDAVTRALAYCISAAIALVIANCFAFLSMGAAGLQTTMTLPETAIMLYRYGMPDLAILVGGFILVLPALALFLIFAICVPLTLGYAAPWLVDCARILFTLNEWSMVEVFLIGVVVSLVKLSQMADVQLGYSFWAYVAFSIFFTLAVSTLDRFHCWQRIEAVCAA